MDRNALRLRLFLLLTLVVTTSACAPSRAVDGAKDAPRGKPAATGREPTARASKVAAATAAEAESLRASILRAEDRGVIDEELRTALASSDRRVRAQAVRALGRIGDSAALPELTRALEDPQETVRQEAAFALGLIGGDVALQSLTAAADDRSPWVRAAIADALGLIVDPAAGSVLARLLHDDVPYIWRAACFALAQRERGVEASAVERLIELSRNADERVVEFSVHALAQLAGPTDRLDFDSRRTARARLLELSRSTSPRVRELVARGLAYPAGSGEADTLIRLAKDTSPRVRIEAVRSFAFPGSPLGPELRKALEDDDQVALAMLQSMARMSGPDVVQALIEIILNDERAWFRERAAAVLTRVDTEQAPKICNALLQSEQPRLRRAAARPLLGRIDGASLDCAARMLQDGDEGVRRAAMPALAGAPDSLAGTLGRWFEPAGAADRSALARTAGWRLAADQRSEADRDEAFGLLERLWNAATAADELTTLLDVVDAAARAGAHPRGRALLETAQRSGVRTVARRAAHHRAKLFAESGDDDARRDLPLEHYREIARWAGSSRAAVVQVERAGNPPARFTLRLDTENAPLSSYRFASLAEQGYYSGRSIERVRPGRSVELFGGDAGPPAMDAPPAGEAARSEFARGTVVMRPLGATGDEPAWFVALDALPQLAGSYTPLGIVVQNLDGVVARLLPDDVVVSVTPYAGDGSEPLPPLGSGRVPGAAAQDRSD